MKYTQLILVLIIIFTLSRKRTYAQVPAEPTPFADENVDDLGDVSDEFQTNFFEALKQKGIQNYERAVTALNRCVALEPDRAILYFERGKNHVFLKQHDAAERDFQKALELKPNEKPVLEALYDLYYQHQDYGNAERIVKQLIPIDLQYNEDLARIYTATKRYDEALDLLERLDEEKGSDIYRDGLKRRLYMLSGNSERQIKSIEKKLDANPQGEAGYLKLIFLYSEQGDTKKAYETALELQKVNPQAEAVQLALYKFYLEDGKVDEAIASMNKTLKSDKIDTTAKHRVLNDFLLFVNKNPSYEPQLEEAIAIFDAQVADAKIYQELAKYYISKGNKVKALPYLEKALDTNPDDLELIKSVILLQLDAANYQAVEKIAGVALDLYPSQPLLYLTYGVALNKHSKFKKAIEQLEMGVDYIIDDTKMEADFYQQLGEAHQGLGDAQKSATYFEKAKTLKSQSN